MTKAGYLGYLMGMRKRADLGLELPYADEMQKTFMDEFSKYRRHGDAYPAAFKALGGHLNKMSPGQRAAVYGTNPALYESSTNYRGLWPSVLRHKLPLALTGPSEEVLGSTWSLADLNKDQRGSLDRLISMRSRPKLDENTLSVWLRQLFGGKK